MPSELASLAPARGRVAEPELSERSRNHWGRFAATLGIGWLVVFGVSVATGLLITGPLAASALLRWDRRVPVTLEGARTATGEAWSHYGSMIGDTLTVSAVAMVVGIGLLIAKRWVSIVLLATAMLTEVSVFVATTLVVPRDRPGVEQLDASPPTSSFPSGHTAAATSLLLSLALIVQWSVRSRAIRAAFWAVAIIGGPVVALSRVYRGMHHPLDVTVGIALGVACVAVALLAVRAFVGERS